jgi:signal transduction histidine kinase
MMAGQTDVKQFFSPAAQVDMVAGFAIIPITGWGGMIPQPLVELVARANDIRVIVFFLTLLGIFTAALISWWLSGTLARPIRKIADRANDVAKGNYKTQPELDHWVNAREIKDMTQAFSTMVLEVERKNGELSWLADEVNTAIVAKSRFLANASHVLRTPLNFIIGFSNAME